MRHWTEAQQWRELKTHEVITAHELLRRYSSYLRKHLIMHWVIDSPRDRGLAMDDNTMWYRWADKE